MSAHLPVLMSCGTPQQGVRAPGLRITGLIAGRAQKARSIREWKDLPMDVASWAKDPPHSTAATQSK